MLGTFGLDFGPGEDATAFGPGIVVIREVADEFRLLEDEIVLLGAVVPAQVLAEPSLDSQNRFYGVVWLYAVSCGTRRPYPTGATALNG